MLPIRTLRGSPREPVDHCALDIENLIVHLAITTPDASCPVCGSETRRVHSRYIRRLADLPCFGRLYDSKSRSDDSLALGRNARAASSPNGSRDSPSRTLAQPTASAKPTSRSDLPSVAKPAPASPPVHDHQSRYPAPTGQAARGRLVPPPRFVGIDDWAWRKGQRYGTIVVDLERSEVIDLLPDRDAETVKTWLKEHPGVELVSRDRWSAYAQAAAEGGLQAQQVADRWHLLKNLRKAIERLLERQSGGRRGVEAPSRLGTGVGSPRLRPREASVDGRRITCAAERTEPGVATASGSTGETAAACRAVRASSRTAAPGHSLLGSPAN